MNFLKNHPFAIEAYFESSVVLTFATAKENLQNFIPECLHLDTYQDKWAFIAIAFVKTTGLRPRGFPRFMGSDFFLIGYRIFVSYKNKTGKKLRGLYILKSQTNKKKMEFLGNLFTHYKYTTTDIKESQSHEFKELKSKKSKFSLSICKKTQEVGLPENSPFENWKEARKFAGPLPFTFSYNKVNKKVLIIEGVRKNWHPRPIEVKNYAFDFLNKLKLDHILLANAFELENIPYYWKKGKIE